MPKSTSVTASIAGLVAVAAVLWWAPWKTSAIEMSARTASASSGGAAASKGQAAALRVSAFRVQAQRFAETISATGTVRAEESVELQPEINGKVVQISFKEGSRVHRGDLLVKLNDADLRAQLSRAVYRRELAELKERRLERLLESGGVRQEDYDTAVNDLNVQRAEVALVEATIAKTEIRAPFEGVIGLRFISEGTFVTPSTKIATLQSIDRVKVDFSVPEKYAYRAKVGARATFFVAGVNEKLSGEIYANDLRVDPATRTVLLRAVCENRDGQVMTGAFANIEFTLSEMENTLLVPSEAVIPGVAERHVFLAQEGKAIRRVVQLGMRTEDFVQIVEGVSAGDVVITSGIQQLRNGMSVDIITQTAAVSPTATGSLSEASVAGGLTP